jgi:ferredoxin
MILSRKDFFRRSFFSLGETLLKAGGSVREMQQALHSPPVAVEAEGEPECEADWEGAWEGDWEPVPDPTRVARADNGHCPARSCGCFSCVECCDAGAISVVMGQGIRIDEALCTGCGTCRYLCPMTPKALRMVARG